MSTTRRAVCFRVSAMANNSRQTRVSCCGNEGTEFTRLVCFEGKLFLGEGMKAISVIEKSELGTL